MSRLDAMKGAGEGAWSLAKHVMGGAAIGGAVNTAAYASGGSLTNSQSAGQAFMSGAGWGAAIGGGFGAMNLRGKAANVAGPAYDGAKGKAVGQRVGQRLKGLFHAQGDMSTSLINNKKSAHAMAIQEEINRMHGEALDMNKVSKIPGTTTGPSGNPTMFVDSDGVASPAMFRSKAALPPPSSVPKSPLSRAGATDSEFSGNIYDQNGSVFSAV